MEGMEVMGACDHDSCGGGDSGLYTEKTALGSEGLWVRKALKASRTVQYKGVFKFSWALLLGNKSLCSLKLGPWRVYFMSSTLNYFHSSRTLTK